MKKQIVLYLALFLVFSQGFCVGRSLHGKEIVSQKANDDLETHLKRIKHIYRPFQTIELSYYCESFDEKIGKWRLIAREEMSWDSSTKNFFNKVIDETPDREKQRECITWNHNNRLFRMHTICEKTPDFRPKQHMKKMESVEIRESYSPDVLGSSATYLMDLHRTLASLNDCKIEIVSESQKKLLKITGNNVAFFFDLKNSQFIRQDFFRKLEDGSHETVATFEFEYMDVDGWLFPKMHVMNFFERKSQHPTHQIRSIISPENVKINKPLDASIFIPKIPAGARIRDKVSGKIYRASGISDEKKEELIAKELDRIFEEAQQKK